MDGHRHKNFAPSTRRRLPLVVVIFSLLWKCGWSIFVCQHPSIDPSKEKKEKRGRARLEYE